MRALMACPFCREMFQHTERRTCPTCGLALKRIDDLPPAAVVGDELQGPIARDDIKLPLLYRGHARGVLLALSVLGLAAFFLPWAHELAPERRTMNGPALAQKLGTMWSPLVAWFVMFPVVLSRRSLNRMRGARFAIAFLSSMSAIASLTRILFPPQGTRLDPHVVEWGLGLYVNFALAVAGVVFAFRFGGQPETSLTRRVQEPDRGDDDAAALPIPRKKKRKKRAPR